MKLVIHEVDSPGRRNAATADLRNRPHLQPSMNKTTITTFSVCAVMGFSARAQNLLLNGRLVAILFLLGAISTYAANPFSRVIWREEFEGTANDWHPDRGVWQIGRPTNTKGPAK